MKANIREAVAAARRHGAQGLLLTDWGDNGHLQLEEVSLPALAWCGLQAWNPDADWEEAVMFCDEALLEGQPGDTACWLQAGTVSDVLGWSPVNANALFALFQNSPLHREGIASISDTHLMACGEALDGLSAPSGPGPAWEQTLLNLRLALAREQDRRHGTQTAEEMEPEAMAGHERLWKARNREGGLAESLSMYTSTRNP
jgi:hypothetical protein